MDDADRRAYGALSKGQFKEHDGVVGEWQFDERRPQQQLEVVLSEPAGVEEQVLAERHDGTRETDEEDNEPQDAQQQEQHEEAFLDAWSRFLFSKRGFGLLVLMAISIALGVLALVYREELFRAFDATAGFIRDQGIPGALLLILAIAVTSYPPLIGYSWCLFACGYIYGWAGFVPAYIGALLGGLTSFLVFRHAFRDWVEKQTRSYPKYVALERALEKEGLPLVILIRLAPYPYPIFNALLSATRIRFHVYAIATAIALVKLLIHISIGKSLSNFSDVIHGGSVSRWDMAFLVFGVVVGIGVGIYLYFRTKQHLEHYANELVEVNETEAAEADAHVDRDVEAEDIELEATEQRRPSTREELPPGESEVEATESEEKKADVSNGRQHSLDY